MPAHPPPATSHSPVAAPEPWDLVADAYAKELTAEFELYSRDALHLAALPPNPRIADVATGPGTLALMAAGEGARVSALDFSPMMIENLRRRAARAGITTVEASVGDGQELPFESDAYDGAFSMFGLIFFPERGRGFRELRRVLRPGARAVVASWAPFEGVFALVFDSIRALLPDLPFGQGQAPLGDPEGFAREMTEAGFHAVQIHRASHVLAAPSLAELWGSMQRTTAPVVLLRRKLGEARWAEIASDTLERLRATVGDGPVEAVGVAHLGVGVK